MQKIKTNTLHPISILHNRKDRFIILALLLLVLVPIFVFTLINIKSSKASVDAKLYWGFDEGYGTTVYDGSGNNKSGTISGASWTPESLCENGKCLSFNGSNNYVSRTYSSDSALDPSNAGFTVSAWFRHPTTAPASGTHMLIARYNGAGYKVYMNTSGFMCFGIDDDATWTPTASVCSTTSYADSKWHFIEAVKNANTSILLYIDGGLINTTNLSSPGSLSGTSPTLYVGIDSDGTSNPWSGFIDEVKYLNGTRTTSDVQTDFNARSSVRGSSITSGPSSKFLSDGLVAYWNADEGSGTTLTDSSGNGLTATQTGSNFSYISGKFGKAVNHAGTSTEYYSFSNTNIGTTNTVSYWTKFNSTGNNYVEIGSDQSGQYASYIEFSSNLWYYSTSNGNNVSVSISGLFSTGTWYFLTVSRNNSSVSFYKNGIQVGTTQTIPSNDSLTVGALYNHKTNGPIIFPLDGAMDDIRIYNRTLSANEILQLYKSAPGPIGYWKMDEGSGTTANDSSGNGNNGNLGGGTTAFQPSWVTGKFGSALNFNGTNNYVDDGSGSSVDDIPQMSISAWIYPTSTGQNNQGVIINKYSASNANGWRFHLTNASSSPALRFEVTYGTTNLQVQTAINTITLNQWQHVAVTWDGTTTANNVHLYINGVEYDHSGQNVNGSGSHGSDADGELLTGDWASQNRTFNGTIDDVKIYNYPRNQRQITEDMNAGHIAPGSPIGSSLVDYNFDEGFGTTLNNTGNLGSTANATTSGTLWNPNGKFGSAVQYNGSSSYISSPQLALLSSDSLTYSSASWEGWFNPSSSIVSKTLIIKNNEFRMTTNSSGDPQCEIYSGSWQTAAVSSIALPLNSWSHVLCTYDGANINVYVNGINYGTTAQTGAITSSASTGLNIGWNAAGGGYFSGLTDEVKIYNFALTSDQAQSEYNNGMAQILGENSTVNNTASGSAASSFCIPGDSSTCNPPIGWWKFDENTGTTTNDSSDNNHAGTIHGSIPWVTGKYGSAVSFNDNTSNYVDMGNNLNFTTNAKITMEAWVYRSSKATDDIIMSKGYSWNDTVTTSYLLEIFSQANGDDTCVYINDKTNIGQACSAAGAVPNNTWTHIVGTCDATANPNCNIYINGKLDNSGGTSNVSVGTISNASSFRVGSNSNNDNSSHMFNGSIDDIRVYNYIRTPAQIDWDMNRDASVARYDFDECSGSTIHNNALNSSGQAAGMNGTIHPNTGRTTGTCSSGISTQMWNGGTAGKWNASLAFDGAGDYISVTDPGTNSALDFSNGQSITLAAWVKPTTLPTDGSYMTIITKGASDGTPDGNYILQYGSRSGKKIIAFCYSDNGSSIDQCYESSSSVMQTNIWQQITFTITFGTGSTAKAYYNGVLQSGSWTTGDGSTGPTVSNKALWIGADQYTGGVPIELVNGQIDDVRIYNYAATANQVLLLYNDKDAVRFGP